jgi:type IV pilus assembly protein PilA
MHKKRAGFTLIELLIVIVIIGILAAIAIPKFGKTREKAYFKAMQSDLRNLAAQQEIYYSDPNNGYAYATAAMGAFGASIAVLDFTPSQGVAVGVTGDQGGWLATAHHQSFVTPANHICELLSGAPAGATPVQTLTAGVVKCME